MLIFIHVKNSGTIRGSDIVTLPVTGGRIMYLKKILQQMTVSNFFRIKSNGYAFGMCTMVPVSRVRYVAACLAHYSGGYTR